MRSRKLKYILWSREDIKYILYSHEVKKAKNIFLRVMNRIKIRAIKYIYEIDGVMKIKIKIYIEIISEYIY